MSSNVTARVPLGELAPNADALLRKEHELHSAYRGAVAALEAAVKQRDGEITALTADHDKLKDDFVFNLRLISERDAELEKHEGAIASLRGALNERDATVSHLKVSLADRAADISNLKVLVQAKDQQLADYELKARKIHDALAQKHEQDRRALEAAAEALRQEHQQTLRLLRVEFADEERKHRTLLEKEKKTCAAALQEAEKAHKQHLFEVEKTLAVVRSEIMHHRSIKGQLEETIEQQTKSYIDLEASAQQLKWESEDAIKVKNARVQELEKTITEMKDAFSKKESALKHESDHLYGELAALKSEYDSQSTRTQEAHAAEISLFLKNEESLTELLQEFEQKLIELKKEQIAVQQARNEMAHQLKAQTRRKETMGEQVEKLVDELQKLQDVVLTQKHEIEAQKAELRNYRAQIQDHLASENNLKKQMKRDRQNFENMIISIKDEETLKREEIMKQMVHGADSDSERDLSRLSPIDRAEISAISNKSILVDAAENDKLKIRIKELTTRNDQLSRIIHDMRKEMESVQRLIATPPQPQPAHQQQPQQQQHPSEDIIAQYKGQIKNYELLLAQKQELLDASRNSYPDFQARCAELERKLVFVGAELAQSAQERARLIDLSNTLKAEIKVLRGLPRQSTAVQTEETSAGSASSPTKKTLTMAAKPGKTSGAAAAKAAARTRGVRNWNDTKDFV